MSQREVYRELDHKILEARKTFDIFSEISPDNEEMEKEKFEHKLQLGENYNPNFQYEGIDRKDKKKLETLSEEISELKKQLGNSKVDIIYRKTAESAETYIEIAGNIGTQKMRELSLKYYGMPSEETIEYAEKILENGYQGKEGENFGKNMERYGSVMQAEEFKNVMEETFRTLDIPWKVYLTKQGSTRTRSAEQEIKIKKKGEGFPKSEVERLRTHEILGHALRSENGRNQGYKILGTGVSGYNKTEEGVTTYLEHITGFLDNDVMKKYAARVKAVEYMMEGHTFKETYDMLREKGIKDDYRAWRIPTRVFRAGGFCKDHIYLEGFLEVNNYIENEDGRLKDLYVGKVSVEDAETLKEVEEIKEPVFEPSKINPKIGEKW